MIIFLFGPDTFRSRQKLKEIKEKFLRQVDASGINMQIIDGKTIELEVLDNALSTIPFLAKKRMVIIENILGNKHREKSAKRVIELISKKSTQDTIIVFWEGDLDLAKFKNNPLFQYLKKQKYQYSFNLLSGQDIQRWIHNKVTRLGGEIESFALVYLADMVGSDLWLADMEVTKLYMYAKKRPITVEDVKTLCGTKAEENIFLLTDALGQKNKKLAIKLIHDQLSFGMKETELLHMCLWHFKNLLMIRSAMDEGESPNSYDFARTFGLHPFVVKKGFTQAKNFQLHELKNIFQKLVYIDQTLKTSRTNAEVLFDLLFIR